MQIRRQHPNGWGNITAKQMVQRFWAGTFRVVVLDTVSPTNIQKAYCRGLKVGCCVAKAHPESLVSESVCGEHACF